MCIAEAFAVDFAGTLAQSLALLGCMHETFCDCCNCASQKKVARQNDVLPESAHLCWLFGVCLLVIFLLLFPAIDVNGHVLLDIVVIADHVDKV